MPQMLTTELITAIRKKCKEKDVVVTRNQIKPILDSLYDIMLEQMKITGKFNVQDFGVLEVYEKKDGYRYTTDINGDKRELYHIFAKGYDTVRFKPAKALVLSINDYNYERVKRAKNKNKKTTHERFPLQSGCADLLNKLEKEKREKPEWDKSMFRVSKVMEEKRLREEKESEENQDGKDEG